MTDWKSMLARQSFEWCPACLQLRPIEKFKVDRRYKSGRKRFCDDCRADPERYMKARPLLRYFLHKAKAQNA